MLVALSDYADGTGTTFHLLSLSQEDCEREIHNFKSNSNFLASIPTSYLWHKVIFLFFLPTYSLLEGIITQTP